MTVVSYPGVYVEEVSSGVRPIAAASTSTPAFVGEAEMGPDEEAKRITNWTEFQRYYGGFLKEKYLAHSVFQFFNNGGRQCYVVRIVRDGAKIAWVTIRDRTPDNEIPSLKISAKSIGAWGNSLCLCITDGTKDPGNEFKIEVRRLKPGETISDPDHFNERPALEVHDNLSIDPNEPNFVEKILKKNSYLIEAVVNSDIQNGDPVDPGHRPTNAAIIQFGEEHIVDPVTDAQSGTDGDIEEVLTADYYKTEGFTYLENIADISLLAVPGVGTADMFNAGVAYCETRPLRDIFYIGEMSAEEDPEGFRGRLTKPNSYGAVYYPWVKALDPTGKSIEPILLPPSGYLAGLFARIDANRGVWKAPAGTEASLSGVVGLAKDLSDTEQGNLNLKNINCIRRFPTAGIVSWGARTITSDTEYQYIPVRRMAIMLRVSIYNGIQWAVFEPNDEELWSQLRLNIRSFMMGLYRQGAFQGATPSDAFFVKCDAETSPPGEVEAGKVNVLIGFAALKPAEFVVVKISQKAGQNS